MAMTQSGRDFGAELFGSSPQPSQTEGQDFGAELFASDTGVKKKEVYEDPIPSLPWGETAREMSRDLVGGGLRGAASIGATIIAPFRAYKTGGGILDERAKTLKELDDSLRYFGFDTDSDSYGLGKFGAEVAGTLGVGGPLSNLVRRAAPQATKLASAIESWGMTGPRAPGASMLKEAGYRAVGGAVPSAASSIMLDPENAETGTAVGAALPVVLPGLFKGAAVLGGKALDYMRGDLSKVRGARLLSKMAGPQRDEIAQAWRDAPPDITAAQAAEGSGRYEMSAMGRIAELHDPSAYGAIQRRQVAEDLGRLEEQARARSSGQSIDVSKEGKDVLEKGLQPERKLLLDIANVGGEGQRMLAEADTLTRMANKWKQEGDPKKWKQAEQFLLRAKDLEKKAADIASAGFKPIDVTNVSTRIGEMLDDPALGSSEAVSRVLNDLNRQIEGWVKKGDGVIDAEALYAKRKSAVNETIDKLLKNPTSPSSQRLSARLAGEVKAEVDKSLDAVTGGKWTPFLKKYSGELNTFDRQELVNEARKRFAEKDYEGFMQLLKGDAPEVVRKVFGNEHDFARALSPASPQGPSNTLDIVQKVGKNVERDRRLTEEAAKATKAAGSIILDENWKFKIPGMISRQATLANATLELLETLINAKTMNVVAEAMKSGATANDLMKIVPAHEKDKVLKWVAMGGPIKRANQLAVTAAGE